MINLYKIIIKTRKPISIIRSTIKYIFIFQLCDVLDFNTLLHKFDHTKTNLTYDKPVLYFGMEADMFILVSLFHTFC
jgi:hypothetical protein